MKLILEYQNPKDSATTKSLKEKDALCYEITKPGIRNY